ncbi:MAG: hypothetical protein ABL862_08855 [Candidatus Nitrotoga sp.]
MLIRLTHPGAHKAHYRLVLVHGAARSTRAATVPGFWEKIAWRFD